MGAEPLVLILLVFPLSAPTSGLFDFKRNVEFLIGAEVRIRDEVQFVRVTTWLWSSEIEFGSGVLVDDESANCEG